jgi:hypothetical protein
MCVRKTAARWEMARAGTRVQQEMAARLEIARVGKRVWEETAGVCGKRWDRY